MDTILQIQRQEILEARYNRKLIEKRIRESIMASTKLQLKLQEGVILVGQYCTGTGYYASKAERARQISLLNHEQLVLDIFTGVAYHQEETTMPSVCSQIASRLGFSDKREAIITVAELLATLCQTDAFDITKAHEQASLMVVSRMEFDEELTKFIEQSAYLPPMVCKPLELTNNYSSGYLGHKDSLILGPANHHEGDICLDVLNTINSVALQLDTDFLCKVAEDPSKEFTLQWAHDNAAKKGKVLTEAQAQQAVADAHTQWHAFKSKSYEIYSTLVQMGNRIYLTNKVDKRGRVYAQGYHVTTQGTPFKKAMLELANEEVVTGVPT